MRSRISIFPCAGLALASGLSACTTHSELTELPPPSAATLAMQTSSWPAIRDAHAGGAAFVATLSFVEPNSDPGQREPVSVTINWSNTTMTAYPPPVKIAYFGMCVESMIVLGVGHSGNPPTADGAYSIIAQHQASKDPMGPANDSQFKRQNGLTDYSVRVMLRGHALCTGTTQCCSQPVAKYVGATVSIPTGAATHQNVILKPVP